MLRTQARKRCLNKNSKVIFCSRHGPSQKMTSCRFQYEILANGARIDIISVAGKFKKILVPQKRMSVTGPLNVRYFMHGSYSATLGILFSVISIFY